MNSFPHAVDLFAGAGGLSLGLHWAGFEVVSAVERDSWAATTYASNHLRTRVVQADITSLSDDALSDLGGQARVDLLAAGPPCQGFSVAGPTVKDPLDPRNSLFMELLRAAWILQPEMILMENVPGLLRRHTASGERVIHLIQRELQQIGYGSEYKVLDAANYGVPQHRKRLFIVGRRGQSPTGWVPQTKYESPATDCQEVGLNQQISLEHLRPSRMPWITLWEAISDLPHVDVGDERHWHLYDREATAPYGCWIRNGAAGVVNHVPMRHTRRLIERFRQVPIGRNGGSAGIEYQPRPRLGGRQHYGQNNRRQDPNKPCATIAASFYANFIHPYLHRNFTPREGARIQSFPDTYRFYGKATVVSDKLLEREGRNSERHLCQYNQIGNAVPPLLGAAIASQIRSGCLEY